MNILALALFILALLAGVRAGYLKRRVDRLVSALATLHDDHIARDKALDWMLRQYELHVADPYVVRPSIVSIKRGLPVIDKTEKRCFHCNTPVKHGHTPECPWVMLQPLVKRLYAQPSPTTPTLPTSFLSFGT